MTTVTRLLTLVATAWLSAYAVAGPLPHPALTPGAVNPDVSQANIDTTICKSGWTATIRPATSYTNTLKTKRIGQYRYRDKNLSSYEEDHLISLQLGGHPKSERNLWPQQYHVRCGARVKDVLETRLKRMVCKGEITLHQAQEQIRTDWIQAYKDHVDEDGCPPLESEE